MTTTATNEWSEACRRIQEIIAAQLRVQNKYYIHTSWAAYLNCICYLSVFLSFCLSVPLLICMSIAPCMLKPHHHRIHLLPCLSPASVFSHLLFQTALKSPDCRSPQLCILIKHLFVAPAGGTRWGYSGGIPFSERQHVVLSGHLSSAHI